MQITNNALGILYRTWCEIYQLYIGSSWHELRICQTKNLAESRNQIIYELANDAHNSDHRSDIQWIYIYSSLLSHTHNIGTHTHISTDNITYGMQQAQ